MNREEILALMPKQYEFHQLSLTDRKITCENLVEDVIRKIKSEHRNPTKWEIDALSQAIAQIFFGRYFYSLHEIYLSLMKSDEVARPDHWWRETDDITLQKLEDSLAYVKEAPPVEIKS